MKTIYNSEDGPGMIKDEAALIRTIIEGHTAQYGLLVERYQNPVFRVIFKIVNNHEEARELTQDVFVKAYESLPQYDPRYKFFSWIYRMAINRALLYLRNRKPCVEPEQIPARECEKVTQEGQPFDLVTKSILVDRAVNELDQKYKTVILLKYFAGLSYAEISETLDLPEKTIKSRLFDARMLLKEKLEKNLKYVD
ncbi:MAG: sigma-70 family RNA polymerase sigma factor [Bacteroidales bacterium]|nr:sigma-70 family RNA polymerase sigma factor [Bacteroidales bacterium]MDD3522782.1 sigma-70 family RNA polymerase sigma factor [Bacteroidales bacterium]MDD4435560.1 sigma-70 family RNA polymerase sigma factor [Bacteroidales bacterium]MDD5732428.1 sigma-70 family RNA polymerase sigma factor [Bacteroidales bacterium]